MTAISPKLSKTLGCKFCAGGISLAVMGQEDAVEEGVQVLQALYERLEVGRSVEHGDVDRELRMGSTGDEESRDGNQLEMFKGWAG